MTDWKRGSPSFDRRMFKYLSKFHLFNKLMSNKAFCAPAVGMNMPTAEDILNREVARVNLHLPAFRPTLSQLLEEEEPRVRLRDGSYHYFKRSELEYLAGLLEEGEAKRLKVPIVLEISTVYRGYFRVRGVIEVKVIDKILGTYDILEDRSEELYPRYLLPKVRRALPTTTTYAFIAE